jgi:hypothetical protein
VRATIFPNPGGDVTRIVSVVDPALVTALFNAAGSATGAGMIASHAINAARVELQRFGFLRAHPGVTVAPPMTRSSGTPGAPSPDLIIFSESGPATLLLPPPLHLLATGVTFNVTPGALPGEVVRNFIVNIPGFIAGGGGLTVSPPGGGVARRAVPRVSGMAAIPNMLIVEASGPGLAGLVRANLPNTANASTMGPLATTPALEQVVRGKFSSSGTRSLPHIAGFEFTSVPADWRVWSSFNSALLTTDDYDALDGARRAALRTWIAGGGILFLTPDVPGAARTERIGAGRIETLGEPLVDVEPADIFGRLQLGRFSPGMPDRDRVSFASGTPIEQVIKFQPLDALWLSIFLVVFATVIGPVNLFWFARGAKRYRLFFTTPLISLAGAAAVAAAIVLEDGLGGAGIRRTLVWLVPGENQAAIFQEQGARTGFLTRRNFPLDDRVLCAALPVDGNVHTFDRVMRVFNREAGRAGGDWFGNRSRQAQLLRGVAPTRARIEFTGTAANGAPIIQSTLTTELRDLRLRDTEGRTWGAASVPMGRPVTLRAGVTDPLAPAETNLNGTPNLNALMKEAATLTEPLQWVAAGSATEFAPIPTLRSIRWTDDPIVYAGFAERSGTASRATGKGSQ